MIAAKTLIAARVCRRAIALICAAALDLVVTSNSHVMAGPEQAMTWKPIRTAEMKKPRFREAAGEERLKAHQLTVKK
jgi:hypothetical protein